MIVTTADLYNIAYGKYVIGAYNVNNLEQVLGLFRGRISGPKRCLLHHGSDPVLSKAQVT
jgi:hypothetical protein